MNCLLCKSFSSNLIFKNKKREFFHCLGCHGVFVPDHFHLPKNEEKKRYSLHENNPEDERYRRFLSPLANPFNSSAPAFGLDFGCGPGPTLSLMLEERGHRMKLYDPFFYPNQESLEKIYDFIVSSEVFEHLRDPYQELKLLDSLLKQNGKLGIMTQLYDPDYDFSKWHYKEDPTHLFFYSKKTMSWISEQFHYQLEFPHKAVALFTKEKNA